MRIRVYGHTGTLGKQLYHWLVAGNQDVEGVSLGRVDSHRLETFTSYELGPDLIFVCVPTPNDYDGVQIQSAIWEVLSDYESDGLRVVIRSTVTPGTIRRIAEAYPKETIYYWPEFLSARTAREDFQHPEVQIVGVADTSNVLLYADDWRENIGHLLPYGLHEAVYVSYETAEAIKYSHNVHGALQIIFANQMYDICEKSGASWDKIKHTLPLLGYVSWKQAQSYWDVWKDDKRGYAGACFPKDTEAIHTWAKENGIPDDLLDGIENANKLLRDIE